MELYLKFDFEFAFLNFFFELCHLNSSKVWLIERRILVAPPGNMESYNKKDFTMNPLMYERIPLHEWDDILHEVDSLSNW